jgi:hypothetical protein
MSGVANRSVRLPSGSETDPDLRRALKRWHAAVLSLNTVEPITTEMVRLRCAWHHDCGT